MVNRNDVTSPSDTINKLASKRHSKDSKALYGDNISPDANAKAGVGDNPNLPKKRKTPSPTSEVESNSSRRIGKDPTESF